MRNRVCFKKSGRTGSVFLCLAGAALALLGWSCAAPASMEAPLQRFEFSGAHMGTGFRITLYAHNLSQAERAAEAAFKRVADLEEIMSDYQADSELNRLRDEPPGIPVKVSDDLFRVLNRAAQVSKVSNGAFDVTMGPHVRLWRFAKKRKVLPSESERVAAFAAVGWRKLKLNARNQTVTKEVPGMRFDLGGIAKGYAADAALAVLKEHHIDRALVAASGDLAIGNPPPGKSAWRIGVADLGGPAGALSQTLFLRNVGISTSGDSEQFIEIEGQRYSHILDPRTGLGLTNRIQATVIARDATASDALATTACILGPREGIKLIRSTSKAEALILFVNGEQKSLHSPGFLRMSKPE